MSDGSFTAINAATRLCAVYGHPIHHSASPALQNAGIAALGLNWRYVAFDVHPNDLLAAIAGARAMKFIGLNLTLPHKLLAVDLVDELDESARTWSAVNTIRFETRGKVGDWVPLGRLAAEEAGEIRSRGFNTDAGALARALREDLRLEVKGATVVLLGAGGAGKAAALKLAADGVADLFLVNRTPSKAGDVCQEVRRRFPDVKAEVGYPAGRSADLLLNATSLGLNEDDTLPFNPARFDLSQARNVYDMIYRPAETKLLRSAKAAGCRTANGLGMLLYQGAEALELWSGLRAPIEIMRRALEENVYGPTADSSGR